MPHLPSKCVGNNIQEKQLINKGYNGINYKEIDRKFFKGEEIKQKSLHEHFLRYGHQCFDEDVSICLIDKTDPSDPHRREYYWMRTLKTIAPFQLNTGETY